MNLFTGLLMKQREKASEDTFTQFRCPGCDNLLTQGEYDASGCCTECYFKEVTKNHEY